MRRVVVPLLIFFLIAGCGDRTRTITGEVFWTLGPGVPYKLGLVTVCAYDLEEIKRHMATRRAKATEAIAELGEVAKQANEFYAHGGQELQEDAARAMEYYQSAQFYMQGLPKPIASSKTDSEGRYTLIIPGPARRVAVGAGTYQGDYKVSAYWMVEPDDSGRLLLANDNAPGVDNRRSLLAKLGTYERERVASAEQLKKQVKVLREIYAPPPPLPSPTPAIARWVPPQPSTPLPVLLVTVTKPVKIKIGKNEETIIPGTKLPLASRGAGVVQVRYKGESPIIPITSTDLK
jgi:hypothetical protein